MGDVKHLDPVSGDSVEESVGIGSEKSYADADTLLDLRCALRPPSDTLLGGPNTPLEGVRTCRKVGSGEFKNLVEVT